MLAFIAPLSPALRKLQYKKGSYRARVSQQRPIVHDLVIRRLEGYGNGTSEIPGRVTMLCPNPKNPVSDQLFIDYLPIPRDAWSYDRRTQILTWKQAYGGGYLTLDRQSGGAAGNIGSDIIPCSVTGMTQSQYSCNVALNTGATYVSSGEQIVGFSWDTTAASWQQADWNQNRLLLTLSLTNSTVNSPGQLSLEFTDQQTKADAWIPDDFSATLVPVEQNGQLVWKLNFQAEEPTPADQGTPVSGPNSVYPYWLQAIQDAWAGSINGVMTVDAPVPHGRLVGFQGQLNQPTALGYYRTSSTAAPFGVFQGRLVLDGKPIADSYMAGDRLYWQNLDPQHQQRTGLPANGCLHFSSDGSLASDPHQQVNAQRLSGTVALEAISQHADLHPTLHQQWLALQENLRDTSLSFITLANMTQFQMNASGDWYDAVQANVTQDLSDIMTSAIPNNMYTLLYPPPQVQPTLSGEIAAVANSPVPGVADPGAWYESLATALLTQGLATSADENAQYFNAPRAKAWLKNQVAASAVYQQHAKDLFNYEWPQIPANGSIQAFLTDQTTNASAYQPAINQLADAEVTDIQQNVVPLSKDPNAKANLIAQVNDMRNYALNNQLYWAYQYYTYFLSSTTLGNIGSWMQQGDGSVVAQWLQTRLATLTALDPSGYFQQQYNEAVNVYLGTNVLPNMMALDDGSDDENLSILLFEYLQTFADNTQNLIDTDGSLKAAMANIASIIEQNNGKEIIQSWLVALRACSQNYSGQLQSLSYIVSDFVTGFLSSQYPKLGTAVNVLGGIFMGAVVGLGIFNLLLCIKSWSQLDTWERSQVITSAVGMGVQIIGGILQRGVRIYAIFQVDGMTKWQRFKAFSKILATGESDDLNTGLTKIGNTMARWLGDTEGSIGEFTTGGQQVVVEGEAEVLQNVTTQATDEEVSNLSKVLGSSLDEFLVTRLAPLMILAGIVYSSYHIATHETGIPFISDIVNIVGGSLSLCALAGEWVVEGLVEGGTIAAESILCSIVSGIGVLGILAALAGIALMIYELFKPPTEDPIKQFLETYSAPAGFSLIAKAASLDYAVSYKNPDATPTNLWMYGFSLYTLGSGQPNHVLYCNSDGSISLKSTATSDPSCVWSAYTDGLGMSQISTWVQSAADQSLVLVYLSLMSDGSVTFQPAGGLSGAVSILKQDSGNFSPTYTQGMPSVVSQIWLSTPFTNSGYSLTSDGHLYSLGLMLQPVVPDAKGGYAPNQASGYLTCSSSGVTVSPNSPGGANWRLQMAGLEPCFMYMNNLTFSAGSTLLSSENYHPGCQLANGPSTPLTYTLVGTVPPFLVFDDQLGQFTPNPNNSLVTVLPTTNYTLTISNTLGSPQVLNFTMTAK